MRKFNAVLPALTHPDVSSQILMALLRKCIIPSFHFLARTTPPDIFLPAALALDDAIRRLVSSRVGIPELLQDDMAKTQIKLSLVLGGCGLPTLESTSQSAFLAAFIEFLSVNPNPALYQATATLRHVSNTYDAIFFHLSTTSLPPWFPGPDFFDAFIASVSAQRRPLRHCQRLLTSAVSTTTHTNLVTIAAAIPDPHCSKLHRIRLSLLRHLGPFDWLAVIPTRPSLRLTDRVFSTALRFRLGLSHHAPPQFLCRFCSNIIDHITDPYHMQACVSMRRSFLARHDFTKFTLKQLCEESGFHAVCEKSYNQVYSGLPQSFRVDIEFSADDDHGYIADVSFLTSCSFGRISGSATSSALLKFPSHAIRIVDDEKISKYTALAQRFNKPIIPLVFDMLGTPGRSVRSFVDILAQQAITSAAIDASQTLSFVSLTASRIAISVQRAMFNSAFSVFADVVGHT